MALEFDLSHFLYCSVLEVGLHRSVDDHRNGRSGRWLENGDFDVGEQLRVRGLRMEGHESFGLDDPPLR